jgi:hypothetical protein
MRLGSMTMIFDLRSKRRRREQGEMPDVYRYDPIPRNLRVQIVQIWDDALGIPSRHDPNGNVADAYSGIVTILRREYGAFTLSHDPRPYHELREFFLSTNDFEGVSDLDKTLDVIELTFKIIDRQTRDYNYQFSEYANQTADAAIEELNARFKEHGLGYFYSDGIIGRVDSEIVHSEAAKPALNVLRRTGFESAQAEFLKAHEHYRQGNNSEALIECYKAFESTMKIICEKRKWKFNATKGAADLVRVC